MTHHHSSPTPKSIVPMGFNLNTQTAASSQPYFQPRLMNRVAPAFGHQVAAPFFPANDQFTPRPISAPPRPIMPFQPVNRPLVTPGFPARPNLTSLPNFPLTQPAPLIPAFKPAPAPPMPTMPGMANHSNYFTPTQPHGMAYRPAVHHYYYNYPASPKVSSKKKNLKKFLVTTGAVMTGMFATAGAAIGIIWLLYPEHFKLLKNLGLNPVQRANKAIQVWKKHQGTTWAKLNAAYDEYQKKDLPKDPIKEKTPWQKIKEFRQKIFNREAYEAEQKKLKEAHNKAVQEAKNVASDNLDAIGPIAREIGKGAAQEIKYDELGEQLIKFWKAMPTDQQEQLLKSVSVGELIKSLKQEEILSVQNFPQLLVSLAKAYLPEFSLSWSQYLPSWPKCLQMGKNT